MPDLNFLDLNLSIDTLYRVIAQLDSASASRATQPAWRTIPRRWISACYCFWFSLPLSFWLSSGQLGLALYWQALSSFACLVEKLAGKPRLVLHGIDAQETTAACCVAQGATQ